MQSQKGVVVDFSNCFKSVERKDKLQTEIAPFYSTLRAVSFIHWLKMKRVCLEIIFLRPSHMVVALTVLIKWHNQECGGESYPLFCKEVVVIPCLIRTVRVPTLLIVNSGEFFTLSINFFSYISSIKSYVTKHNHHVLP